MLKANCLKIKHQPLLLGISLLIGLYGIYFGLKSKASPMTGTLWTKTAIVYLNCLAPCLLSLILAIQRRFEDQRPNFNGILSLPKRTSWLLGFSLSTYWMWLINILIFNLLMVTIGDFSIRMSLNLWVSLAILNLVWVPIIEYVGIMHGYLACIGVGIMTIPFMIYYGTTALGAGLWYLIPWVYGAKIYLVSPFRLMGMVLVVLLITTVEQIIVNWRFNHWSGN
ncbi:hypothetical protein [Fructilactobacillus carniphilus]|uniref:Lantibiotic ABC transporter permease n=1 Tax=Fructilactobacillus carniphilus TaxID=2940297 RepID=A0ABY5BY18_9LACO|nr:hypothetical protein [Fructilactobacillus carniphilus]USS90258.1 hypothetical protein M3M37_05295 [Fructilactobacillus carniphilus]